MSPDGSAPAAPAANRSEQAGAEDFADIVGFIDGIGGNRVSGWAWNRENPDEHVEVEIRLDNETAATVTANRPRPDLAKAGIGDGSFGFEAQVPEQLGKDDRHRVTALVRKPGRAGVIRLKNQTAVGTEALALRPSDFSGIVERLDQCVEDQRAGFRWIYHELQGLDEFVRGGGGLIKETPAGPAQTDLADEFCAIESRFAEIIEAQTAMRSTLDGIAQLQQSLNRRLEQMDVFNARLDATLSELRQAPSEAAAPPSADQPGLRRLVIFLALLTVASLATGIVALLR